ncbi:hypothetical protein A2U01_0100239, partial [Trifolium medium]|nr:hypothetical protein [Trifolium medium]
MSYPTPK